MFSSWFNTVNSVNSVPNHPYTTPGEPTPKGGDTDTPLVRDNSKSDPMIASLVKPRSPPTHTITPRKILVKPKTTHMSTAKPLVKYTLQNPPLVTDKNSRFGRTTTQIHKGSICTVKSSHPVLGGKSYRVEGSIQEVLGVDDPWMSPKTFSIPALSNYITSQNPPAPYHGTVYYGKIDHLGYCVHEDYL